MIIDKVADGRGFCFKVQTVILQIKLIEIFGLKEKFLPMFRNLYKNFV